MNESEARTRRAIKVEKAMHAYLRLVAGDDPEAMQRERDARQPRTEGSCPQGTATPAKPAARAGGASGSHSGESGR